MLGGARVTFIFYYNMWIAIVFGISYLNLIDMRITIKCAIWNGPESKTNDRQKHYLKSTVFYGKESLLKNKS